MGWISKKLDQAKLTRALANAHEEHLYAQAAHEVSIGDIRPGLWAKSLSLADGDEQRAQARYVALRVEQMQILLSASEAIKPEISSPTASIIPNVSGTSAHQSSLPLPEGSCSRCRGKNVMPAARGGQRSGTEKYTPYCLDCRKFIP